MATGPPPSTNLPQPESSPPPQVSWDGDRMFNIYIYDYCMKRGYQKTARELLAEADLSPDSQPPINAKQGLLFEWWSVFWVLFSAKSNGSGTEDAMMYTQHQASQARPMRLGPQPQTAQQPRYANTNGARPPPGAHMPNGIPTANGPPTGQSTLPNGAQPSAPFPSGVPQPNGAPGPTAANPTAPGASTPAQQPQVLPGQRLPQQQRLNGAASFHSPTMAPAPQNPGGVPGNQPGAGTPAANLAQPLNQMGRGGMLPPNGPPVPPGNVQIRAGQTPQVGFQPLAPSASQPSSPATNSVTAPSPSLATRQLQQQGDIRQLQEDIFRIPTNILNTLKQEVGVAAKDLPSLSFEEKRRIVEIAKQRGVLTSDPKVGVPGSSGLSHPLAGPSGLNPTMHPPNQQQRPQVGQPQGLSGQQPGQQNHLRAIKRSSDSPPEVNDSSPPKRLKTDGPEGAPPMTPMLPYTPQQGPPGGPQQGHGAMVVRPMGAGMPGFPGQLPNATMMHMGQTMGGSPMAGMPPGLHNPAMMGNQYRQNMHTFHQNKMPPGSLPSNLMPPTSVSSPAAANEQFGGDGNQSRPGTGQFGAGGPGALARGPGGKPIAMMPPPNSPGVNATKKDGIPSPAQANASPRNPAMSVGQAPQPTAQAPPGNTVHGNTTAPPTPVPAPNTTMPTPTPSAILNGTTTPAGNQSIQSNQAPPSAADPLGFGSAADFMDLTAFDANLFEAAGDVDFGVGGDFGNWFTPDTGFATDK